MDISVARVGGAFFGGPCAPVSQRRRDLEPTAPLARSGIEIQPKKEAENSAASIGDRSTAAFGSARRPVRCVWPVQAREQRLYEVFRHPNDVLASVTRKNFERVATAGGRRAQLRFGNFNPEALHVHTGLLHASRRSRHDREWKCFSSDVTCDLILDLRLARVSDHNFCERGHDARLAIPPPNDLVPYEFGRSCRAAQARDVFFIRCERIVSRDCGADGIGRAPAHDKRKKTRHHDSEMTHDRAPAHPCCLRSKAYSDFRLM